MADDAPIAVDDLVVVTHPNERWVNRPARVVKLDRPDPATEAWVQILSPDAKPDDPMLFATTDLVIIQRAPKAKGKAKGSSFVIADCGVYQEVLGPFTPKRAEKVRQEVGFAASGAITSRQFATRIIDTSTARSWTDSQYRKVQDATRAIVEADRAAHVAAIRQTDCPTCGSLNRDVRLTLPTSTDVPCPAAWHDA